jgi:DNA polymerase-3 subunit alpha
MSLFGMHTGVVEDIILPKISGEINRREILNWERELIGLYVSDHPLSPVMEQLTNAVTHFSGQLSEASANERVRVAGLITLVRSHMTKTGKAMAFVTLEDLQGTVELVIFPKTWEKFGEMLEPEQIVMVDGRVDNAGAEPKVLVDNVSTEFKVTTPFENGLPAQPANLASRQPVQVFSKPQAQPASVLPSSKPKPVAPSPIASSPAAQKPGEEDVDLDWLDEDTPPPPEEFPLDWEIEGQKILAPAPTPSIISTAPGPETENVQMSGAAQVVTPISASFQIPSLPASRSQISESELPPFFVSSQLKKDSDAVHMITVIIRSTGDKTRDVLRMRRIHGLFSSYPGSDRFAFYVFERNHNYLLEFPNFTTGWCPDLIDRLNRMVGTENVKVEPITYQ